MRGSQLVNAHHVYLVGIIPAHAGLTAICRQADHLAEDHPRACGAHFYRGPLHFLQGGSSPRMRGSPLARALKDLQAGIIPAHAGLTNLQQIFRVLFRDHPRACGAHIERNPISPPHEGSSPRMRGSHRPRDLADNQVGIIPAHAGLTKVT